jgi:prepilin-type N-terminal cleavage/methylation domain-containing protein
MKGVTFRAKFGSSQRGFSMVEVLAGFAILSIAMASAVQLSITLAKVTQRNHYLNSAVSLAESKLEELRNADFAAVITDADPNALDESGNEGETYTRSWTVSDDTPVEGLKYVEIVVTWNQMGGEQSYRLNGVVGS